MRAARVVFGFVLLSRAAVTQQYVISTVAGGTPAPPMKIESIAVDASGNIYFDGGFPANSVFKLDSTGKVTLVAGTLRTEYSGDGGPAIAASLYAPEGLALDREGNLFIADKGNHRIRRIAPDGIITTVAGGGRNAPGDGGPATDAQLSYPGGLFIDRSGNLFIGELGRVRKVTPDGIITTVVGGGNAGLGDGGPATSAQLGYAAAIALDNSGNLFIQDPDIPRGSTLDPRIRKVSAGGIITTVAGGGMCCYGSMTVDGAGNLFTATQNQIWKIAPGGIGTIVAGNGTYGNSGDGGPATKAQLIQPGPLAVDGAGNLFLADGGNGARRANIRRVSPNGIITTLPGGALDSTPIATGDGGPATRASLEFVVGAGIHSGIAVDRTGNVFIAETYRHRIRRVSPSGIITTVVGGVPRCPAPSPGDCVPLGDGGPATSAALWYPMSVAVDNKGNLFIADTLNYRVRKVSPDGIITTVAGDGERGNTGDGGPATSAALEAGAVAVDGAGNLFVSGSGGPGVRKVSPDGIISTVFNDFASNLATDSAGNLFIVAESCKNDEDCNFVVHKLTTAGALTTVLDVSLGTFGGTCSLPNTVVPDSEGNLFVAEAFCNQIAKVGPNGAITIVAGQPSGYEGAGYFGDGGLATDAALSYPTALAADGAGNVFFTDDLNEAVRVLRPARQAISAAVDAASQKAAPISPGKIVVLYGVGLGPTELVQNRPNNGVFSTEFAGTTVSFNGRAAPVLYTSASQVAAIVPYAISGDSAEVTVSYQGRATPAFSIPVAAAAPSLFTFNRSGAGQAAAINVADGMPNTAAHPVRAGDFISLYATGEGRTSPEGVDGKVAGTTPAIPSLRVTATVGGIPAAVQYAGGAPGQVAGLMQVNLQVPAGVQRGGYVPVVLTVGDVSTTSGAVWVAVAGN